MNAIKVLYVLRYLYVSLKVIKQNIEIKMY